MDYRQIALVSEIPGFDPGDLARVSAAIQKQIVQDFAPLWSVMGTIDAFPSLDRVPVGYSSIVVTAKSMGAELGVHYDEAGQPHAVVEWSDSWSISASHECLEMLLDPWGNRLENGHLSDAPNARVQFLVEVCDPCQDANYAYMVNDTLVSDFYAPAYFEPVARSGARYSLTGAITRPLQVLPGGYLSWYDPASGNWWQRDADGPPTNLGPLSPVAGSMRQQVNARTAHHLAGTQLSKSAVAERVGARWTAAKKASHRRGEALRSIFMPAKKNPRGDKESS